MKKFWMALAAFFIAAASHAQQQVAPADPLRFKELEFSFGKIPQSKPVYHQFELVNESSQPIKIDEVHASCGCTTPEWSREPIAPGATAKIKVGYNAASVGEFTKTLTVSYGGTSKVLYIKGEVWKAPDGPAPENASVLFLKKKLQP